MECVQYINCNFFPGASEKAKPISESDEKMRDDSCVTTLDSYEFAITLLEAVTYIDLGKDIKLFSMDIKSGAAIAKQFAHQTQHRRPPSAYNRIKVATSTKEKPL